MAILSVVVRCHIFITNLLPRSISRRILPLYVLLRFVSRPCCFGASQSEDSRREGFKKRMRKHLGVIVEEALELIDAAADQMGKRCETPSFILEM